MALFKKKDPMQIIITATLEPDTAEQRRERRKIFEAGRAKILQALADYDAKFERAEREIRGIK